MSDKADWRRRLRTLAARLDRDVEDELRFHIQEQVDDLVAEGLSGEDARREALRRFGDLERVEAQLNAIKGEREKRMTRQGIFSDIGQDFRYSFRRLRMKPGFSLVVVLVLALGIGANTAVFGVVDAALLRTLPFPRPDQLVFLWDGQEGEVRPVSYPEFWDWERENDFLQAAAVMYGTSFTLMGDGGPEQVDAEAVSGEFLEVLGLSPVLGRGFDPAEVAAGDRVVMLGELAWRGRYGGRPDVIGTTLPLDGEPYTVIGVMPREAGIIAQRPGIVTWFPLVEREWMSRGLHFMRVIGRLRDDVEFDAARSRAEVMAQSIRDSGVTRHGVLLEKVRERFVRDARALLLLLSGAVVFLMLIVCANLATLFLSNSAGRSREFSIRTALGAGRLRLARQVVTESLLLGILGGAVGLALGHAGTGFVSAAADRAAILAPTTGIDARVVIFTAVLSLLAALAFGLAPALRASRPDVAETLKENAAGRVTGGRSSWRTRKVLVGAEIALSVMLLVGAGLMLRSVASLLNQDTGFDPEGVLTLETHLPSSRFEDEVQVRQFFQDVVERARSLPGVENASIASHIPLSGDDTNGSFAIPGRSFEPGQGPHAKKRIAGPGYFETLRIPLLRGRTFTDGDRSDSPEVAIISQSLAERYWPDQDPVGQKLEFRWGPGDTQEIIGVVGDVRHDGLDQPVEGTIYVPHSQFPTRAMALIVRSSIDPLSLVRPIRDAVARIDPQQAVFQIMTMEQIVRRSISTRRTFMALLVGFAGIALVLATVGVYAITAGSVGQRTQEIGVRMAVGAEPNKVLRMVVGEEARVILAGLILGLAGAFVVTRALSSLLFQVSASDPLTFAAVIVLLAGAALAAAYLPARRASATDPMRALRVE